MFIDDNTFYVECDNEGFVVTISKQKEDGYKGPFEINESEYLLQKYSWRVVDGVLIKERGPFYAERTQKEEKALVDEILDKTATGKGYYSITSACSFASVDGVFQEEGIRFCKWREAVWTTYFSLLGEDKLLTVDKKELKNLLPKFEEIKI